MNNIKVLTINGILAALYISLVTVFAPISFGPIQIRIAASLLMLIALNYKFIPGLLIGTIISNLLFSPLGIIDSIAGGLLVLTGSLLTYLLCKPIGNKKNSLNKKLFLTGLSMSFSIIFVALVMVKISNLPFLVTYLYLIVGQSVSQLIGAFFIKVVLRNQNLAQKLITL